MNRFNPQDKYFRKAKEEGFRARSAFKLDGIQNRFNLIKPGMNVLDLGAAPGSFLQYIGSQVGEKGLAVGIDLQQIEPFEENNILTFAGDICDDERVQEIIDFVHVKGFNLITSDLAPKTTGIANIDGNASLQMNLQVLEIAKKHLRRGGGVIMKMLGGFNEGDLIGQARKMFRQVKKFRPDAIRKSSNESYIICLGRI